jgi:hypothetical protein
LALIDLQNVTRYRMDKTRHTVDNVNEMCKTENRGQIWEKFKGRLKGVFYQEHWLSKLVADYYTPKPSVRRSSMSSMLK